MPETHLNSDDLSAAAREEGIPVVDAMGHPLPIVSPSGYHSWSLVDLILTLINVLLFVLLILRISLRRKENYKLAGSFELVRKKVYPLVTLVALVAMVTSIVLFLLTQDILCPMVLFDWWTLAFVLLLIIALAASSLALQEEKEAEEKQDRGLEATKTND